MQPRHNVPTVSNPDQSHRDPIGIAFLFRNIIALLDGEGKPKVHLFSPRDLTQERPLAYSRQADWGGC
ncbi:MAG: hypothetical protein ACFCU9_05160 [Cyanophyceae cyanobacterium]